MLSARGCSQVENCVVVVRPSVHLGPFEAIPNFHILRNFPRKFFFKAIPHPSTREKKKKKEKKIKKGFYFFYVFDDKNLEMVDSL